MPARTLRLVEDELPALDRGPVKGGRMKIAFTTNDMKSVNAHFAGARTIAVWEVGQEDATFVQAIQFDNASAESAKHDEDGDSRVAARIAALEGCSLLFVKAIGGPAAAKVVRANVHPVKLPTEETIADVITRVQGMMQTPPPWLRKAMLAGRGDDFDFLEDDEV